MFQFGIVVAACALYVLLHVLLVSGYFHYLCILHICRLRIQQAHQWQSPQGAVAMESWGRQAVSRDSPVHTSSLDSAAMGWHVMITMAWCLILEKLRYVYVCVFVFISGGMTAYPAHLLF